MNRFWNSVLRPVLDTVAPRLIVEVGVAHGALTTKLLDWAGERDVIVHAIDPQPQIDVAAWRAEHRGRLVFHKARSLNVLGRLDGVDVALIDGDHNWYTVTNELRLLERTAAKAQIPPPLIALHDVDWPYGRRDLYYKPDSIPEARRQPYERKGMLPGQGELVEGGLNDDFNNAIYEHAIRNGVRTAIEDFVSETSANWEFFHVPGLHGLGILAPAERLQQNRSLGSLLKSFRSARFLTDWCEEIELARIKTEIEVARRGRKSDQLRAEGESERRSAQAQAQQLAEQLESERHSAQAQTQQLAEQLESERHSAQAQTQQLAEQLESERHSAQAQTQQLAEQLESERHSAQAAADSLAQELDRVENQRRSALSDAETLAQQLERGRERREDFEAEIDRLEQVVADALRTEEELREELSATRDRIEELQSPAEPASPERDLSEHGAAVGSSSVDGFRQGLASVLRSFDERMNLTIAERDPAFNGNQDAYIAVSRSAVRVLIEALASVGTSNPRAILDLPCGYGRVTRALRAAWPNAELIAADRASAAVAFCVEQFGAEGWVVEQYPPVTHDPRHRHRYDLIWSGSLLTSLDPERVDECISVLLEMLAEDGVLVAAYHGRDSAQRFSNDRSARLRSVGKSVNSLGVGFVSRGPDSSLGTTAMSAEWLLARLMQRRDAMVVGLTERGWADHLDVIALLRRDVHHAQLEVPSLT